MIARVTESAESAGPLAPARETMILQAALASSGDPFRVYRASDDAALELYYQNQAAETMPEVSTAELCEAFSVGDGIVLRPGRRPDSVSEMRANRFEIGSESFVVTIERDVTQRDHLERAYDAAAAIASDRGDRYFRLGSLFARPAATADERIGRILGFVLRELQVGTAVLIVARGISLQTWTGYGDPARQVEIPSTFLHSALETFDTRHATAWPPAADKARFSSVCVLRARGESAALCLGNRDGGDFAAVHDPFEFLRLCATFGAMCSERYLPVT